MSYTPYTPEKIYTQNGVYGCIFEYTPGQKGVYAIGASDKYGN